MTDAIRLSFHPTGLAATLAIEVSVVRSAKPRRCAECRHRRVCYALTLTDGPVGNPDFVWRCREHSGLLGE